MILPNQLTVLRIILTPFFIYFFMNEDPNYKLISLFIFLAAALTDWYDGWLARKYNYITNWGKFWDPLADKILTSAAFIGLVINDFLPLWMVLLVVIRDLFITILRGYADYKNITFSTSLYAKWKTFIQMIFLYYYLIVYVSSFYPFIQTDYNALINALTNRYLIYYTMLLVTIITVHSGINYIWENRKLINSLLKD